MYGGEQKRQSGCQAESAGEEGYMYKLVSQYYEDILQLLGEEGTGVFMHHPHIHLFYGATLPSTRLSYPARMLELAGFEVWRCAEYRRVAHVGAMALPRGMFRQTFRALTPEVVSEEQVIDSLVWGLMQLAAKRGKLKAEEPPEMFAFMPALQAADEPGVIRCCRNLRSRIGELREKGFLIRKVAMPVCAAAMNIPSQFIGWCGKQGIEVECHDWVQ